MKKISTIRLTPGVVLLAISIFGHCVFVGNRYPTSGIVQQMAGTVSNGTVTIDLLNSSEFRDTVRFGLSGGELILDTDADTSDLYAALRFAPRKNVYIDVGIHESIGGSGNKADNSTAGVPVLFRLTLGIWAGMPHRPAGFVARKSSI